MAHPTPQATHPAQRRLQLFRQLVCACVVLLPACATSTSRALDYTNDTRGMSPIPANEQHLPTATAPTLSNRTIESLSLDYLHTQKVSRDLVAKA